MKIVRKIVYHLKYYRFLDWFVWKFQNPYKINIPYGLCPVQSEGFLKTGEWYYFRARGSNWSLEICESERHYFQCKQLFCYVEKNYLPWPQCGYLSKRKCIKLATKALNKYYENKEKTKIS